MRLRLLFIGPALMAGHFAASAVDVTVFPKSLATYATWQRLTPDGYAIPPQLAALCTSPAPVASPKSVDVYGPHVNTFVRVFANPLAAGAFDSRGAFPEGSILVKEKRRDALSGVPSAHGVMIKRGKGFNPSSGDWEFLFYPSSGGASFTNCTDCHRAAEHDFVFGTYRGRS